MDKIINRSRNFYYNNKKELFTALVSTYVLGLIAHAYGFFNNIFSHDSLNALYADEVENLAKISVGRFFVPLIRLSRSSVALPWIIGILGLLYISISVFLIIKMLDIKHCPAIILVSGIMVTNVSVISSIATYIHEFDLDVFALLLAVLSVYIWKNKNGIGYFFISIFLAILSFGIYQSNVTVITTLMIIVMIKNLFEGESAKNVFRNGVIGVIITGISSLCYYALSRLFPVLLNVETASRTDALNVSDFLTQEITYLNSFNAMVYYEIETILHPSAIMPQKLLALVNIVLLLSGIISALYLIIKLKKNKLKEKILLVFLFSLLPISVGFIDILTKGSMHEIMTFSFWFIPVLILVLSNKLSECSIVKIKSIHFIRIISVICIALTIWNNILLSNTAYLKKDLEQSATITSMTRIISDLEKREDYTVGETELCIIGADFTGTIEPGFDSVTDIEGLEFISSIGAATNFWYYNSYEKYFRYFLNYPVNIVDHSFITSEIHDEIMEMPSFPSDGYIHNFNGVLVIKAS